MEDVLSRTSPQSWKRMILQSERPPAWLSPDSPHGDVVLSSRVRIARNVRGYRFPHRADRLELEAVRNEVIAAFSGSELEVIRRLSRVEWEHWVGARLISLDFDFEAPGRSLILSPDRALAIMVNEEDHVRIQSLSAGWSIGNADELAIYAERHLSESIRWAWSPEDGFLTASVFNVGSGRRLSAMFHLIGLAHQSRLPSVLRALVARGMVTRGLFGESSRAVGAFVQVSALGLARSEFVGACEYLLEAERVSRAEVGREFLIQRVEQTLEFIDQTLLVGLADAFRVLGWLRWGAVMAVPSVRFSPRQVDGWLSALELTAGGDDRMYERERAEFLRECVQGR